MRSRRDAPPNARDSSGHAVLVTRRSEPGAARGRPSEPGAQNLMLSAHFPDSDAHTDAQAERPMQGSNAARAHGSSIPSGQQAHTVSQQMPPRPSTVGTVSMTSQAPQTVRCGTANLPPRHGSKGSPGVAHADAQQHIPGGRARTSYIASSGEHGRASNSRPSEHGRASNGRPSMGRVSRGSAWSHYTPHASPPHTAVFKRPATSAISDSAWGSGLEDLSYTLLFQRHMEVCSERAPFILGHLWCAGSMGGWYFEGEGF